MRHSTSLCVNLILSEDKVEAAQQVLTLYQQLIQDNKFHKRVKVTHRDKDYMFDIPLELYAFYRGLSIDFTERIVTESL